MINIFSTAAYIEQLSLNIDEIKKYCYDTREKLIGRDISNKGGWQSNNLSGVILPLNYLFIEITKHGNLFANKMRFSAIVNDEFRFLRDNILFIYSDKTNLKRIHVHEREWQKTLVEYFGFSINLMED